MKKRFKSNPFSRGPRNLVFLVLFFVICIGLLTKLTDYTRYIKTINHSAFIKAVEKNQVKSIHISGQEVDGIFTDGSRFETIIDNYDPKVRETLREHNVDIEIIPQSNNPIYWHLIFMLLPLLVGLVVWYYFRQSRNGSGSGGGGIFNMGKSRAKVISPASIKENFDSVAGAQEAKQELQDIVDFLRNPEKYRRLGGKIPRGVLLVGEPGNGKTLLAKAVAGEANCQFFSITGSDFIEVFVGVGAARVRDLFMQARRGAPSIIFIDEIDAIGRQRGSGFGGGHDEREQTLNQLLTEMDGFDTSESPVIVIAATNMPEVLDKALLRPGRFDRRVEVPYPDLTAREEILKIHARSVKLDPAADLSAIAKETSGFSGADLANLMNKAAINASKNNSPTITQADLEVAHRSVLDSQKAEENNAGGNPMTRGNSKPKMFLPSQVKTSFADVAGCQEAKEELQDFVNFLKNPKHYRRLGAKLPRGVLLVGEPGNGKTLLAKAVAGEANCPFFSVSASEFVEIYVGVGASRVRELFAQARKHQPCIVFIDEIDAVGAHRDNGPGSNDERNQTLNQLLTELDGFDTKESSIIVMAATNRPDVLDKALLRPGRLEKRVEVPYPDLKSREDILRVHCKGKKLEDAIDLSKIARGTPGFSGASLAYLVNEAVLHATKQEHQDTILVADFEAARDKIMLGKELKTRIITPREREVTAYHESGHALIPLLMPEVSDPLYKVTIVPRGRALGVTHSLPEGDRNLETKDQIVATIMRAMGGRAAEELIFNEFSSGASSDFAMATGLARRMVCNYGMTDELGPVVYNEHSDQHKYSEKTAQHIDETIRKICVESYAKTIELLRQNRDMLDKLAKELLEKETLFASEIYELLGVKPRELFKLT